MKLFVAGTDTGVGKTWVSAAIASNALRWGKSVAYYKPLQTGSAPGREPEDPQFIHDLLGDQVDVYCRYCFEPPVAPSVADVERCIDLDCICQDVERFSRTTDLLLVEGAGGLTVPLSSSVLLVDLIKQLEIPVLLVSHCRLGTMNHTLLSVEALQTRRIPIKGIVFNFYPADSDIHQADLAVQTLLTAIRPHVPKDIPLWNCPLHHPAMPVSSETLQIGISEAELFAL